MFTSPAVNHSITYPCLLQRDIKLDERVFDPDRNVQRPGRLHGDVDLADADQEAHPYNYQSPVSGTRPNSVGAASALALQGGEEEMRQRSSGGPYYNPHGPVPGQIYPGGMPYGDSPYPPRPLSDGGISSAYTPTSPGGVFYPPSTTGTTPSVTTTSQNPRSAKQREVAARAAAMHLTNEDDGSSAVHQHQDGGRIPQVETEAPREIPPAYDSITEGSSSNARPTSTDAKGLRL